MKVYMYNMEMFHNKYDFSKEKVLFEVTDDIDVFSILYRSNKYYVVCMSTADKSYCGVKEITYNKVGEDKDYTTRLECPYCSFIDNDSFELSDESDEHNCGRCGSTFSYERQVEVSYCSTPVKANDVIIIK